MKAAILGGSFNPIHNGHLQIANELLNKEIAEEVWFIPCGQHPFDKELIEGEERMNMIKAAVEGNSKLKVLDLEILSDKISFTSQTIKKLKKKFKGIKFLFIVGADNLGKIKKWHDFDYLKKNVKFILVRRPDFEIFEDAGIEIDYILEMKNDISSTSIRDIARKGNSIRGLVPRKVENYIIRRKLYNDKV